MGVFIGLCLTYWPPVRSVVDQIANNGVMAMCAVMVLMTIGCIPGGILAMIDHIRRLRQRAKAAAAWRDGRSQ